MTNKKIAIYHSVLTEDLICRVREFPREKPEHRVNITSWPSDVVGMSGPIMLFDVEGDLKEDLRKQLYPIMDIPDGDHKWSFIYTLGSRLSFIPWHTDVQYLRSCTVYLNQKWSRDWAGMFLYENNPDDLRAIYPEYNKAVVLHPPILHTTAMPAINAPLRESLQVFVSALP